MGDFEEIVITVLEGLHGHDTVFPEVVRVLGHLDLAEGFLLPGIEGPEDERIPGRFDERILEFDAEAVLLDGGSFDIGGHHGDGVLVLAVAAVGALLDFLAQFAVQGQLHRLVGGTQHAQGVGLVIIDKELQRVGQVALVVHP